MATKSKAATAKVAPAAATPVAPAANPSAALTQAAQAPAATAPSAKAKMLEEAAKVNNCVMVNGKEVKAANNVAARHASLNGALPVTLAQTTYAIGKTPKLRVGYTQENWPSIAAAVANGDGKATAEAIKAAGATTDFIRYAIKSGWLVAA